MENEETLYQQKFKNTITNLFKKNAKNRTQSRQILMKKIKNIILSNENLNHREDMDFNFKKEYRNMNKTMKKFNKTQNNRKNIVDELSKANKFFSQSYSNMLSSLISQLENKNINYRTISNFNTKYLKKHSLKVDNNFFFQNPLLLTKEKDMNNFYLYGNNKDADTDTDADNDQYLNYSKKILNKINNQFTFLKVNKILEELNNKTLRNKDKKKTFRMFNSVFKNNILTERNDKKSQTDRNNFKLNRDGFFSNRNLDSNNENKMSGINIFKKNVNNIGVGSVVETKKKLKEDNKKLKLKLDPKITEKYRNSRNSPKKKIFGLIPLSERNSKRKLDKNFFNKLIELGLKDNEINNLKENLTETKVKKMKRLKGTIQIKSIYDDFIKTKKIIDDYKKFNNTKIKNLYYYSGKKVIKPFQQYETENNKINKIGYKLFWTINK